MRSFIALTIVLSIVLIAVAKLLDNLMGIFMISVVVCLLINVLEMEKNRRTPKD